MLTSPEFLLVAASCGWPPSISRNAAVRAAAAPIADWNDVAVVAQRQRVAALVYDALLAAGVLWIPPDRVFTAMALLERDGYARSFPATLSGKALCARKLNKSACPKQSG